MKIGVYSNPQKDPSGEVRDEILDIAARLGVSCQPFDDSGIYDLVVSVGGDGTILRVAKRCAVIDAPILGVNKGTVGFLTEVEPSGFEAALKSILAGDLILERRALLEAETHGKKFYALNDVVILRTGGGRMINMEVRVADEMIDRFACDGYIACTPTGSTAYSLSAGGAVIGPNTPVIALTPINPHTLRTRPVVVGSFEKIEMKYVGPDGACATVYIDGEATEQLCSGDSVKVTGWDRSVKFVRFGKTSFYSRLLGKLNSWSAQEE